MSQIRLHSLSILIVVLISLAAGIIIWRYDSLNNSYAETQKERSEIKSSSCPHSVNSLIKIYYDRPDLQSAYPEAKSGYLGNLTSWSLSQGIAEYDIQIGKYSHVYRLLNLYYNNSYLQSAFPEVAKHELKNLFNWASTKGIRDYPDILGEYDYIYDLMKVYNDRPDLQSAYPEACDADDLSGLYIWASQNGINENPLMLSSYTPIYDLMHVYYSRSDLQNTYPEAANGIDLMAFIEWAAKYGIKEEPLLAKHDSWLRHQSEKVITANS